MARALPRARAALPAWLTGPGLYLRVQEPAPDLTGARGFASGCRRIKTGQGLKMKEGVDKRRERVGCGGGRRM